MTDSTSENMVLRTIYLPIEVDRELKSIAFSEDISKAELMRRYIQRGLDEDRQSGEQTLAARIEDRIAGRPSSSQAVGETSRKKRTRSERSLEPIG